MLSYESAAELTSGNKISLNINCWKTTIFQRTLGLFNRYDLGLSTSADGLLGFKGLGKRALMMVRLGTIEWIDLTYLYGSISTDDWP